MNRDRRMENGNGQRNRKRNIGQVQVQDQGEVYIQREMDRKTDGDRGKNILGTWKGTAEQEKHDTDKNRGRNMDMNRRTHRKGHQKV